MDVPVNAGNSERTRIKMCGMTREEDVRTACALGADAVGFVCAPSPRRVEPARLPELAAAVAPFVTPVLLFVDADRASVQGALAAVPNATLQFHGSEDEAFCRSFGRPYLRAVPMAPGVDLLEFQSRFSSALALLLDSARVGEQGEGGQPAAYGGSGRTFDWALLAPVALRALRVVLAGGLDAANVAAAIEKCRPYAVDVSSGIEELRGDEVVRGIKSASRMHDFIAAVRRADLQCAAMQDNDWKPQ